MTDLLERGMAQSHAETTHCIAGCLPAQDANFPVHEHDVGH